MTVAIAIERWLVITYPFQSRCWFTTQRTKLIAATIVVFASLLALPRFTSRYVTVNPYKSIEHGGYHVHGLHNMHYYISRTSLTDFWRRTLKSVHYQIDFWVPLPLLLVFNLLSFHQVIFILIVRVNLQFVAFCSNCFLNLGSDQSEETKAHECKPKEGNPSNTNVYAGFDHFVNM